MTHDSSNASSATSSHERNREAVHRDRLGFGVSRPGVPFFGEGSALICAWGLDRRGGPSNIAFICGVYIERGRIYDLRKMRLAVDATGRYPGCIHRVVMHLGLTANVCRPSWITMQSLFSRCCFFGRITRASSAVLSCASAPVSRCRNLGLGWGRARRGDHFLFSVLHLPGWHGPWRANGRPYRMC